MYFRSNLSQFGSLYKMGPLCYRKEDFFHKKFKQKDSLVHTGYLYWKSHGLRTKKILFLQTLSIFTIYLFQTFCIKGGSSLSAETLWSQTMRPSVHYTLTWTVWSKRRSTHTK